MAMEPSDHRWYTSVGLGWNYADRLHVDDIRGVIDFDFGLPAASLAVGMNAFDNWRFELEGSYEENAPEIFFFRRSPVEYDTRQKDRMATTSLMLNALREFRFGIALQPYVGLGIGPAQTKLRFTSFDSNDEDIPLVDDETWTFAYQVIAGVTLPLSQRLALGIEYRYWQAPGLELADLAGNDIDNTLSIQSGWMRLKFQPGGHGWYPSEGSHPSPDARGLYLSAALGLGYGHDRDLIGRVGQLDAFKIGTVSSVALGYRLGRRWRVELEGAHRNNDMQIFDVLVSEARTTGDISADSLMLNVTYRFRPTVAINPWIGAGVGIARMDYDLDLAATRTPLVHDDSTRGAVQVLLGFDIAVTPRWTVTADYRMFLSDHTDVDLAAGGTLTTSHQIHSWSIGARYSLADPR